MALPHSFVYSRALNQFEAVEHDDPDCAMAYWGEAMSLYHQLWDRPSASDLANGRTLMERAEAIGAKRAREQGYILATHLHNAAPRTAVEKYDESLEALKKTPYAYVAKGMANSRDEAHAWLHVAEGENAKALDLLREVAERRDKTAKDRGRIAGPRNARRHVVGLTSARRGPGTIRTLIEHRS